jgi:hypothetical protein
VMEYLCPECKATLSPSSRVSDLERTIKRGMRDIELMRDWARKSCRICYIFLKVYEKESRIQNQVQRAKGVKFALHWNDNRSAFETLYIGDFFSLHLWPVKGEALVRLSCRTIVNGFF